MSTATAERTAMAVTKVVEAYKGEFEKVLPRHMRMDHFMRCAVTYIKKNPGVGECTQESIMKSLMDAAQLGLAPDGLLGSAYLVPFNNKVKGRNGEGDRWEKTCQLVPGYRGLIDLARRSDQILSIVARPVLEGDDFSIDWGRPNPISHKPNLDGDPDTNAEQVRGVYALATLKDGTIQCEYMSRGQIDRIKNRSQAAKKGFSPWQTDWTEMARKTVVKRLCKYLPLSPEMAKLIQYDNDTEIVHDVEVTQADAEPQASKAAALAQQLGHDPRADIAAEAERLRQERELEEAAAQDYGGGESRAVSPAGGTAQSEPPPPDNGEDAERAHNPTSANAETPSNHETPSAASPPRNVAPKPIAPNTKIFVRMRAGADKPDMSTIKQMSDTDLSDAHEANEAALADQLADDELAHRLGVKAALEEEMSKRK